LKNKSSIKPKDSRPPENVSLAVQLPNRAVAAVADMAVAAADSAANVKCILLYVLPVVFKPRFLSSPMDPSLFIAESATSPLTRQLNGLTGFIT
jgi:hypothetical protein